MNREIMHVETPCMASLRWYHDFHYVFRYCLFYHFFTNNEIRPTTQVT